MSQNPFEVHSTNDEDAVSDFLDCIAYLIAKRWLKDQRSVDQVCSMQRKSLEINDEQE